MNENNIPVDKIQEMQNQLDSCLQTMSQLKDRLDALTHDHESIEPIGLFRLPLLQDVEGDLEYCRLLNSIFIQGTLRLPSSDTWYSHFAQLPVGFQPSTLQTRSASGVSSHSSLTIEITPKGTISCKLPPLGNPPKDEIFAIDISFHI